MTSASQDIDDPALLRRGGATRKGWSQLRGIVSRRIGRLAVASEPFCRGWRWFPSAVLAGGLPVAIAMVFRSPFHQLTTAIVLMLLCLGLAWRDAWWTGVATIGIAFATHCGIAIFLAHSNPVAAAEMFPDGADYWQKQHSWIRTGVDVEYELSAWVPAHAQLLIGSTVFSFTSLGAVTFYHGMYEVDLMNYYTGQLLNHSQNGPLALVLGWHVWSVLRGLGYTILSFELVSLALQVFSQRQLVTWGRRGWRFGLGLLFLLGDGVVKATLMESVRLQLFENLV